MRPTGLIREDAAALYLCAPAGGGRAGGDAGSHDDVSGASRDLAALGPLLRQLGLLPIRWVPGAAVETLELAGARIGISGGDAALAALRAATPAPLPSGDEGSAPPGVEGVEDMAVLRLHMAGGVADRATAAQRLCVAAAMLAPLTGTRWLYWSPARLWSRADALAQAVIELERAGLPPILHIVRFDAAEQPGGSALRTAGLDWFVGQEMHLYAAGQSITHEGMVRRAARIAIDMLLNGPFDQPGTLRGLDTGEMLHVAHPVKPGGVPIVPIGITAA